MNYINLYPNPSYFETIWWMILSLRELFILGGAIFATGLLLGHIHLHRHFKLDNTHKV
jgi:hypothetical protein